MKDFDEDEAFGMAAEYGKNASEDDIKNVEQNMGKMNRGPLAKVWDKVVQLWNAFRSPDTPLWMKSVIIGALIYMVSPIDVIPDVIPVLGLADDASVIGLAFSQLVRMLGMTAVVAAVIKVSELSYELILEKINEKNKDVFSYNVERMYKEGNFNYVAVGLYNEEEKEIGTEIIKYQKIRASSFCEDTKFYGSLSLRSLKLIAKNCSAVGFRIKSFLKNEDVYEIHIDLLGKIGGVVKENVICAKHVSDAEIAEGLEIAV